MPTCLPCLSRFHPRDYASLTHPEWLGHALQQTIECRCIGQRQGREQQTRTATTSENECERWEQTWTAGAIKSEQFRTNKWEQRQQAQMAITNESNDKQEQRKTRMVTIPTLACLHAHMHVTSRFTLTMFRLLLDLIEKVRVSECVLVV